MFELHETLGQDLGVRLAPDDSDQPASTIGALIRQMGPTPIEGHIHLGLIQMRDLSPEALHRFAKIRNAEVLELIKEYVQLSNESYFGDALGNFRVRSKYPELQARTSKHPEYQYRHSEHMARAVGFTKMVDQNSIASLKEDSVASAFLIPTYSIYEHHYAQGSAQEQNRYRSYKAPPNFTRDMAGWRNYILSADLLATRCFSQTLTAHIPLEAFKKHAYIVGGSGSGKSELMKLLVHHLIRAQDARDYSGVVIDPHGDLAEEIARLKAATPNRVVYFNPEHSDFETPAIDIFSPPDDSIETIDSMAGNIADAFAEIVGDAGLSTQMRALLVPCIATLLRRPNSSLTDLQRFMVNDHNADLVALGQKSPNSAHASFFRTGFAEKTYEISKRSLYTRLQTLLNSTIFRRMVNPAANFDVVAALEQGKILVFSTAKKRLGNDVSQAFGRLLIAQIKNLGFRRQNQPKSKRRPTFVFVDECQNFVGESIETTLNELRKYGIHMILANQVIGQNMSSQLTNILLSNTAVKVTGHNGDKSLSIMAREMGADLSEMKALTTGRFVAKVNTPGRVTQAFTFQAPNYLVGNRAGLTGEAWLARKKSGWEGYVPNAELDRGAQNNNNGSLSTSFDDMAGHSTRPDFVDPPETKESVQKPRFDV